MRCHHCNEVIEVGEAMKHEPLNGSGRFWFFHPGCHLAWKEQVREQTKRLENIARLAGTVH